MIHKFNYFISEQTDSMSNDIVEVIDRVNRYLGYRSSRYGSSEYVDSRKVDMVKITCNGLTHIMHKGQLFLGHIEFRSTLTLNLIVFKNFKGKKFDPRTQIGVLPAQIHIKIKTISIKGIGKGLTLTGTTMDGSPFTAEIQHK